MAHSESEPRKDEATPSAASAEPADYTLVTESPTVADQRRRLQAEQLASLAQCHKQPSLKFGPDGTQAQFSLTTLLGFMTLASAIFAVRRFFPPDLFAGVCGLVALSYPLLTSWFTVDWRESPLARQIWLLLLGIYITAIGLAMAER